jgi:hypothetical protein
MLRSTTNSRATGAIPVSLSTADVVLPAEEQPVDAHGTPMLVDGEVPAELFLPEGAGPWPGIVMGAEAYGPNHATRTVSAALAQRGFAVLLPDYHRGAGPVDRKNYEDFTEVTGAIATSTSGAPSSTRPPRWTLREPRLQRTQWSSAPRRRRPRRMGGGSRVHPASSRPGRRGPPPVTGTGSRSGTPGAVRAIA